MKAIRLVALTILSAMLVACGGGGQTSDTTAGTVDTTTAVETEVVVEDDLPDTLDFEGREFRVLSSLNYYGVKEGAHNYLDFEETGDVLDDAIFRRNLNVMERFGVTLVETTLPYHQALTTLRTSVNAGDDEFDVVSLVDRDMLSACAEGLTYFIDKIPLIDFDKPYWTKSINDGMTLGNRHVLAYSDMVLEVSDMTHVLLYNKRLAEDLGIGELYTTVEEGKWTFDKFEELSLLATQDLNGNGEFDDEDRYGWIIAPKQINPLIWVAGGGLTISKDADDFPVYSMNNEKMLDLLETAYNFSFGNTFWYENEVNGVDVQDPPFFASDRGLFAGISLSLLFKDYYRSLDFDYGIIPYPKYDESQETYLTRCEGGKPYGVPITAGDTEFSGAMLEAMACESYKLVRPAYYEIALKGKFTRDDQSVRILDDILDNRVYDLGDTFFCNAIRDGFVLTVFKEGKQVMASDIESNRSKVEDAIKAVVDVVKEKA